MKVILGFLLLCVFVSAAMLTVVVALVIKLLPIILIAAVVGAVVHVLSRRRRGSQPGRAMLPAASAAGGHRVRSAVGSRPAQVHTAAAQGGWVFVPVWVAPTPRPARPYVDAEVVEDDRGG
jgi:hypothetical protein